MALLSRRLGLLFIMAPHTGCTAIGTVLRSRFEAEFLPSEDVLGPDGLVTVPRKHSRLSQMLEAGLLTTGERAALVVAAGVRNPFDEEVSHYRKMQRDHRARRDDPEFRRRMVGDKPPPRQQDVDFETWLRRRYAGGPLDRLLRRPPVGPPDFTAGADVILRFEHLQDDVDALFERLGVPERVRIPTFNRTGIRRGKPYQAFYTPRARALVEQAFAERIRRFGYRFEEEATAS
jgi:hypothetical protein